LVAQVKKDGPACHTGAESCFFETIYEENLPEKFSLEQLYALIQERKDMPKEGSYTSYLFEKGKEKILKKIGEESTEVVIGAMKEDREETVYEVADLAYHVLVLMNEMNISVKKVADELAKRHVVDHKVKQETMK
jgi:phosphoribosyl-ATP pyrophosphohydrolase/phosphoribosyl-AMP cyclohydrolase